ncbi:MAG: polyketide synthase, partial [Planctomycetaceae bacterium]
MSRRDDAGVPLAIVGMACRFPGADNLDEFWSLIRDGRSSLVPLPDERLNRKLYYDPEPGTLGKTYCALGGVVEHHPIDRRVFPIDEALARRYDAAHLTLCEVVAAALRHAGYNPLSLPYRNTGVYVGNSSGGTDLDSRLAYNSYAREMADPLRELAAFKNVSAAVREDVIKQVVASIRAAFPSRFDYPVDRFSPHAAATLMVEAFGLTGPAVITDAACASSLMALQLAAPALREGRIEMAIVAGAAYRKPCEWVAMALSKVMSARGCCPFDADADGLISSDGYAAVVVKTLNRALADGDRILGVVRGIGMSCDGRGKGFWAPRKEGQVEAIRRAYSGGLDPSRVQYIEAHATSTQLGDATEVAALNEAFAGVFKHKIPIASVKANIGHTLESAGIAGLIKTLLAMQHGVIPPAANFNTPNPAVDWEHVPFYVPTTATDWPAHKDGHPRRAGIDSFGIGGLNLHVVIDDAPYASEQSPRADFDELDSTELAEVSRVAPCGTAEPIAIIGAGAIFAGANTVDAFRELLHSSRDPKQRVPADRWDARLIEAPAGASSSQGNVPTGGFITGWNFDWRKFKVAPKQVAAANPLQFMLLDAADQALTDAGYGDKDFDGSRVATVVGTMFQSDFIVDAWHGVWLADFRQRLERSLREHGLDEETIAHIWHEFFENVLAHKPAARDDTGSMSSSTLASRIAKHFDFVGGAMTIDAGDASSLAALEAAVDLLRQGSCDTVVCAAGQRAIDRVAYEELAREGNLASGECRSPFDACANGIVPGEGVGVVVLKRLNDAQRDGNRVLAIIREIGAASDARSAERALRHAIQSAMSASQLPSEHVDLVDTNVTSREQSVALENALVDTHDPSQRTSPLSIGSLTAQIGATQAASGMASLLKIIFAWHEGRMPSAFGLTKPANSIAMRRRALDPLVATREIPTTFAAVSSLNSRGFVSHGGSAYHLLLEASPQVMQKPESSRSDKQQDRQTGMPDRMMSRFILRSVESPLPSGAPSVPTLVGPAVILGKNAAADALCDRLLELGATVYSLSTPDNDASQIVAELDRIWQQGPVPHLFLMTARDDDAAVDPQDVAAWARRRQLGVQLPFLVCQRWFELVETSGMLEQSSLVAATTLGGDFGFSGHCRAFEGGGLAGMLKSVRNETRGKLT